MLSSFHLVRPPSIEWPLTLAARAQSESGRKSRPIISSEQSGGDGEGAYLRPRGVAVRPGQVTPTCCAARFTFIETPMRCPALTPDTCGIE